MTRKLTAFDKHTVAELEAHLDDVRDEMPRSYLREVMAARNAKVRQEQYDIWGLSEEEYVAAKEESAKGDTPLHVLLNRARAKAIKETREVRTAKASSASVGARGRGV